MAAGTGGIVGIFTVEIPPALQISHAHGGGGEKHTQATADHRATGIGSNCPEIINLFQVGYGDGGGKGTGCLVGGNRYLVVPGGGGGDCSSSVLIAPADLHRGVLPARAVEDAGKHGRLPRRLGDTHRPETGRDDGLGNGGGGANQRAKGEKEGFMDAYRSHDIILSVALRAGQRVAWVKRKNSQP